MAGSQRSAGTSLPAGAPRHCALDYSVITDHAAELHGYSVSGICHKLRRPRSQALLYVAGGSPERDCLTGIATAPPSIHAQACTL